MVIKTNNNKEIEITESYLVIKDKKLFNKQTGCYEGLDGDKICFSKSLEGGYKVTTAGTVDGYTNNGNIRLKGVVIPYKIVGGYSIEHTTIIVDYTDENAVRTEIVYAE